MNVKETANRADERIFQKLADSPFFQTYRKAFNDATGLNLTLLPADHEEGEVVSDRSIGSHANAFCRKMNEREGGCASCKASHRSLAKSACGRPNTATCFAGMRETLIPVRSGERTFAMLSIGQIFTSKPGKRVPLALKEALADPRITEAERGTLEKLWRETSVLTIDQYQGTVTLLAAFALQLADILNRLLIEEANAEPEVVVKAKRFVNAHLEDKISLESVAQHAGVSPYYFCKVFKQSAGMTLTEFVNRRRVEWAKRKLLNPQARVTEVAFDVGFQSISQFNRSFLKYVGESPTRFRENQESASRLREMNAA